MAKHLTHVGTPSQETKNPAAHLAVSRRGRNREEADSDNPCEYEEMKSESTQPTTGGLPVARAQFINFNPLVHSFGKKLALFLPAPFLPRWAHFYCRDGLE
jgi:hypothetical protein